MMGLETFTAIDIASNKQDMIFLSKTQTGISHPTQANMRAVRQDAGATKALNVMLFVERSRSIDRDFLIGVGRYARKYGPWSIRIQPATIDNPLSSDTLRMVNGIIARIPNRKVADVVCRAKVPVIALGSSDDQLLSISPLASFPTVCSDPNQVVQVAVDFFLERRIRHFAYVGISSGPSSNGRRDALVARLRAIGYRPNVFEALRDHAPSDREWTNLSTWLSTLPRPIGLLACNDELGRHVLIACRAARLRVPEDVAVLGVENDVVACELSDPPLSSIALDGEGAGYRAAELLDDMMSGRLRDTRKVPLEAVRVVKRRSTEIFAVEDADVGAALEFIHNRPGRRISVTDVVNDVAVSRRLLERRFKSEIGRTILDEIRIVRFEHAKRLLLETAHPISMVARMSGYGSVHYFSQLFRARTYMTPRQFRCREKTRLP